MSKYFLAQVEWTKDYSDVKSFESKIAQFNYISKSKTETVSHNNFIQKNSEITVKFPYNITSQYNYIAYTNDDKLWEYAFIDTTTVESLSNAKVKTTYDVWQNYFLQMNFGKCHIEREHTQRHRLASNDRILATPHYMSDLSVSSLYADERRELAVERYKGEPVLYLTIVSQKPKTSPTVEHGDYITTSQTQYSPVEKLNYVFIPFIRSDIGQGVNVKNVSPLLEVLYSDIWSCPNTLSIYITPYVPFNIKDENAYTSFEFYQTKNQTKLKGLTTISSKPIHKEQIAVKLPADCGYLKKSSVNSNELKNIYFETKLLSTPYFKIKLNLENSVIDRGWEDLRIYQSGEDSIIIVNIETACGVDGASIKYTVDTIEDGEKDSISQSVKIGNMLPLTSEKFIDYIFNSRQSYKTGLRNQIIQTGAMAGLAIATGGAATPLLASSAISTASSVSNEMNNRKDLKQSPSQVRGTSEGIDSFSDIVSPFICLYIMRPRKEEQLTIYDFYNRFGYKVNRVKTPKLKSRKWFNYIKMYEPVIRGIYDNDDLLNIKSIFRTGTTIWHTYGSNVDDFKEQGIGNYDKENAEQDRTIYDPNTPNPNEEDPTGGIGEGGGGGGASSIPNFSIDNPPFQDEEGGMTAFTDFNLHGSIGHEEFKTNSSVVLCLSKSTSQSNNQNKVYLSNLLSENATLQSVDRLYYQGYKDDSGRFPNTNYIYVFRFKYKNGIELFLEVPTKPNFVTEPQSIRYESTDSLPTVGSTFSSEDRIIIGEKTYGYGYFNSVYVNSVSLVYEGEVIDILEKVNEDQKPNYELNKRNNTIWPQSLSSVFPLSLYENPKVYQEDEVNVYDGYMIENRIGEDIWFRKSFLDNLSPTEKRDFKFTIYGISDSDGDYEESRMLSQVHFDFSNNMGLQIHFTSKNAKVSDSTTSGNSVRLSRALAMKMTALNVDRLEYKGDEITSDFIIGTTDQDYVITQTVVPRANLLTNNQGSMFPNLGKSSPSYEDIEDIINDNTKLMFPFRIDTKNQRYVWFFGGEESKQTIQFVVQMRTPIYPISDGTVIEVKSGLGVNAFSEDYKNYDYNVKINHGVINGNEITAVYGGLTNINVKVGDVISDRTSQIALAGTRGYASGTASDIQPQGFIFELRVNGQPVDPLSYLHTWR